MNTLIAVIPLAFNSTGLESFVITKIIPLVLLFIGLGIIAGAKKGNMSQVMNTTAIVIIGCIIIGAGGALVAFGDQIANLIFA